MVLFHDAHVVCVVRPHTLGGTPDTHLLSSVRLPDTRDL